MATTRKPRRRKAAPKKATTRKKGSEQLLTVVSADGTTDAKVDLSDERKLHLYESMVRAREFDHVDALWDRASAAIDPTGTKVLTSDDSKRGLMWLVEADDVLALAERRVARPLTPAERARYADLLGD